MKNQKHSALDIDNVIRRFRALDSGKNLSQVAREEGVSRQAIFAMKKRFSVWWESRSHLSDEDIRRHFKQHEERFCRTPADAKAMVDQYEQGNSAYAVATAFNCSPSTVYNCLRDAGVSPRKGSS